MTETQTQTQPEANCPAVRTANLATTKIKMVLCDGDGGIKHAVTLPITDFLTAADDTRASSI